MKNSLLKMACVSRVSTIVPKAGLTRAIIVTYTREKNNTYDTQNLNHSTKVMKSLQLF